VYLKLFYSETLDLWWESYGEECMEFELLEIHV